jgi:hypothetical protein
MTTALEHPAPTVTADTPPRSPQIWLWLVIGVLSTVVIANGWIRWLASDQLRAAATGPDEMSAVKQTLLWGAQAASCTAAATLIWIYLLRPLLRERRLTLDGKLLVAAFLSWFYDPLFNYFSYSQAWNSHLVNLSSWVNFIPGWSFPNSTPLAEPLLFTGPATIWGIFGSSLIGCALIERLRRRHPTMSNLALFACLGAIFGLADIVFETVLVRGLETAAYPDSPHFLTLFAGKPYQLPVLEPVCIIPLFLGVTAIRYFRDSEGRSVVERGAEQIRSPRFRQLASLLAVTGALHVVMVVGYQLPWQLVALKADTAPVMPSYFRIGDCGSEPDHTCRLQIAPPRSTDRGRPPRPIRHG